jgi:branched-chain amino acid transport system permease protein
MDNIFFSSSASFGPTGSLPIPALHLLWFHFAGASLIVFMAMTFALLALALAFLRRGPFGRLLFAIRDSEEATTTLGLSLTAARLLVFALSAAIAGLGGALLGEASTRAGGLSFSAEQSLPIVLIGVVGGIATTSGAFAGGFTLGILASKVQALLPGVPNVDFDVTGVAGALSGYLPNGIVPSATGLLQRLGRTPILGFSILPGRRAP